MSHDRIIYVSRATFSELIEALKPEERFLDLVVFPSMSVKSGLVLFTPNQVRLVFSYKEDRDEQLEETIDGTQDSSWE